MAKVPTYAALMPPILEALKTLGGSATIQEIKSQIITAENYTDDILDAILPSGRNMLDFRLAWTHTRLKYIGMLEDSDSGVWTITKRGREIKEDDLKARNKEWEQKNHTATEEIDWKDELLDVIKNITPEQFERLTQRVLREAGFIEVKVTGERNDLGIDGEGILKVNLLSFRVVFQCKRYKDSVGSPIVRDFRGAMQGRADRGLIVTTGTFTKEARIEARRIGGPIIDLIDGDEFCDLLKKHNLGVSSKENKITKKFFENF